MDLVNHQVRLAARPVGLPKASDFQHTTEPVGEPADGELVVRLVHLSLDPAMRGWMNEGRSYIPPVGLGEVMRANGVGRVVASRHPGFAVGQHVVGLFGIQEYARSNGKGVMVVDENRAPLSAYLGVLGMTGLTAYFGLLDIGKPKAGETVVVSGAAGATGSVAGQIARLEGCRAVGIAGGAEKCRLVVEELGFDACVDYKAPDLRQALAAACPDGVHVYFDNVGGEILDVVLSRLARHARVVICGAISQYNSATGMRGPAHYMSLLVNRARMEGFVVFDYAARYPEALAKLSSWYAAGKLRARETVVEGGVAAFPQELLRLFAGDNVGKLVLNVE